MEKYGVEQEIDVKTAQDAQGKKKCPSCCSVLRPSEHTGVLLCPTCGSKPFER